MTAEDENLPRTLSRRNWIILAIMIAASCLWRSLPVTLGVASGGLLAIFGFGWMRRSLNRVMARPNKGSAARFQFTYLLRLATIAAVLYLLIAKIRVNPWGLAAGLSVVVANIFWMTIARLSTNNWE